MITSQTRKAYPTDLNDNEWNVIAPLMPQPSSTGRPREHTWREVLNAIFYVTKNGCHWRALPHDFPPWQSIYHYFRLWRINGKWERLNKALREQVREKQGRHKQPSAAILDSQSVKTVEGGEERGYDAGKKVRGRKRHLIVDTLGLVLLVVVTAASVQDRDGANVLLGELYDRIKKPHPRYRHWWRFCRLKLIWADGSYRGELIEWVKRTLGWHLKIVEKAQGQKGFVVLPRRWVVERTFAWLNRQRRLSKDYEHLPQTSEAFIYVAMIRLMVRNLAHV
jgi:putative transposase